MQRSRFNSRSRFAKYVRAISELVVYCWVALPLGAEAHELIDVAVHDIKECGVGGNNTCKTKTAHDGYEESKMKSMTNEELVKYVKKTK